MAHNGMWMPADKEKALSFVSAFLSTTFMIMTDFMHNCQEKNLLWHLLF